MSELLALGASHKTAPLAVRERLALLDGQVEPFLRELVAHPEITEAVAVSTCNRTELYVVGGDAARPRRACCDARAPRRTRRRADGDLRRTATATRRATCTASSAAWSR